MISYSRQEIERQLVADAALWRRVPTAFSALLWPMEILVLGWSPGSWIGLLTVLLLGIASVVIPPRLRISIYLVDLLDRFVSLPLGVGWLAVIWHLSVREPIFPLLGIPLPGAAAVTGCLWLLTRGLVLVSRFLAHKAGLGWRTR